jgi:hypothetical protein
LLDRIELLPVRELSRTLLGSIPARAISANAQTARQAGQASLTRLANCPATKKLTTSTPACTHDLIF